MLRRRDVRWAVMLGYLLVASGVPLPVVAHPAAGAKDRSVPFPCMDSPCGCVSARQCFESCCCHTPAELKAWAEANGVEAPLLSVLEQRMAVPEEARMPAAGCETASRCGEGEGMQHNAAPSCCGSSSVCCEPLPSSGRDACCGATASDEEGSRPLAEDVVEPLSNRAVVLQAMLACGGLVSQWCSCGGSPPPPPREEPAGLGPACDRMVLADQAVASAFLAVESPPPRSA